MLYDALFKFSFCISMTRSHYYCLNDNASTNKNTCFVTYSRGCPRDVLRIILQFCRYSHHLSLQSQIQLWLWLFHLHKMHARWEGSLKISANKSLTIWKTGDWLPLVASYGFWHARQTQTDRPFNHDYVRVLYDTFLSLHFKKKYDYVILII